MRICYDTYNGSYRYISDEIFEYDGYGDNELGVPKPSSALHPDFVSMLLGRRWSYTPSHRDDDYDDEDSYLIDRLDRWGDRKVPKQA